MTSLFQRVRGTCVLSSAVVGMVAWASIVNVSAQEQPYTLSGVLAEVARGPIIESRHYGRLVAVSPDGEIHMAVGDPQALILPRSALKPFQALPAVQWAIDHDVELSTEEIAIMCASHEGHDYHVAAVAKLLQRMGAEERALHCGEVRGTRMRHNCSGKHSGMLLHAQMVGAPMEGYWEIDHPVQQRIREAIQSFTNYDQPLQWGVDGCGVPNYALPLYHLALGYARLAQPDAAPAEYRAAAAAIRRAMLAHPELISSRGSFDAQLMDSSEGRVLGKTGAEACYGMAIAEPALGVAIKIEDGHPRSMPQILLAALDRLQAMSPSIDRAVGAQRTASITNSRGDEIGQIRPSPW